ncbi:hypothetical protein AAC387_Pa01g2605 [Persea americana]
MADDENEGEEIPVEMNGKFSLTASTCAAAPGPKEIKSTDNDNDLTGTGEEFSQALFMSHHFVFSVWYHENLTLEPDISKICSVLGVETDSADFTQKCGIESEKGDMLDKFTDENLKVKEL